MRKKYPTHLSPYLLITTYGALLARPNVKSTEVETLHHEDTTAMQYSLLGLRPWKERAKESEDEGINSDYLS